MKNFNVYAQLDSVVKVGVVTAKCAVDALRIAKQKGFVAPIIGEAK